MPTITAGIYGNLFKNILNGSTSVDWDTDTIKVMLTTSAYTPDQDNHQWKSDVTNEVSGTGYTAGGATLASKTVTYTAASNTITLDAADVVWTNSTITMRHAVVYKDTGTAATSPLICYQSSDADISTTNGDLTIQWNANGIISIVV